MAYEFKLPDIGEGVVEGEIVKWLIKEGDSVIEDQPIVEVMTDKATVTISSPKKGKIAKCIGAEGDIAKVHHTLVVIETTENAAPAAPAKAATTPTTTPAAPKAIEVAPPVSAPKALDTKALDTKVLATPVTRRIASEQGIDLTTVDGSGPQGRILKRDVLSVIDQKTAPSAPAPKDIAPTIQPVSAPVVSSVQGDEKVAIRGLRKAIWKKMVQSESYAVPFTYVEECDLTDLVLKRESINAKLAKTNSGKLTYLPFIIKATIAALRKFPHLNAIIDEEKQEMIVKKSYNIGFGVATDEGLTVAVMHNADQLSLLGISKELERLSKAAREKKLTMQELSGSTFTISSLGKDGGMFATPVINHPEVAILGIHRLEQRPVVIDKQIVIRDRMYMSCSFDHRVIDGHIGAAFVCEVIRLLQDPEHLLIEM